LAAVELYIRLEWAEKAKCDNVIIMPCGFVDSHSGLFILMCAVTPPIEIEAYGSDAAK
jgi:hypothetical protein